MLLTYISYAIAFYSVSNLSLASGFTCMQNKIIKFTLLRRYNHGIFMVSDKENKFEQSPSSSGGSGSQNWSDEDESNFFLQTEVASTKSKLVEDDKMVPPPPPTGRGEWEDWDTDAYIGDGSELSGLLGIDEVETKSEGTLLELKNTLKSSNIPIVSAVTTSIDEGRWSPSLREDSFSSSFSSSGGKSAAENWEDWSEEPPYFDDDEGNKGHLQLNRPNIPKGSSDLWTRVIADTSDSICETEVKTSSVTSTIKSTSDIMADKSILSGSRTSTSESTSSSTSVNNNAPDMFMLVLEMNRQFAAMETKLIISNESKERKLDQLIRDVEQLRNYLTISIQGILVVMLTAVILIDRM